MRNFYVLSLLVIFIIHFKINFLLGASVNSSNLKYWKNQLRRTIRQANVEECAPPTILNGNINIIKRKSSKKNNFLSLNVTCDSNYILQPPSDFFMSCFNGFWDVDEIPQCKRCIKRSERSDTEDTADSQLFCQESFLDNSIYKECGQRLDKTHQPFVVNGTVSKFAEFPWHVAIYKKDQYDADPLYHCGGSIINENSILTVAHCFSDDFGKIITSREYYVAAGKYHRKYTSDSQTSQRRNVIKKYLHPRYRGELANYAWDIAIVTVHEPIEISTLVHPVCIDWKTQYETEHLVPAKYGEVAGWGKSETYLDTAALELRVLKVPFIDGRQCLKSVPNTFIKYITHDKFCAGYTNGSSVCDGDSGGGLVFERQEKGISKYYIRGLVSVGLQKDGRCDEYKYSTYTKVSEYISFIRETIEKNENSTTTALESSTTTSLPDILINPSQPTVSCKTPNNEVAKCISIYDCKIFINALQNSPSPDTIKYIKDSVCGKEGEKTVCCGSTVNQLSIIHSNPITSKPIEHRNLNLLPTPGVCGRQTRIRKGRIVGGTVADLYDYPWMALLEYGTPENSAGFLCAGFLINERYVLTIARCAIKSRNVDASQVFRVRLGEHNLDSEIDCVNSICNDPPLNVDIEKIFVHPSYNSKNRTNDIALLRLAKSVSYTDFIKPICLPVNGETSLPGKQMFMAGWGATSFAGDTSSIKLKVSVSAGTQEECINAYKDNTEITESHLCIHSEEGKDSCQGDSGSPVMATLSNSKDIYAEGIVSFGKGCGFGVPSLGTRVTTYMDWILEVIRP